MQQREFSWYRTIAYGICVLALFCLTLGNTGTAAAEEPFEITISTIPAGFASYIMGVALAEQINQNSTWLKAIATEGRGPAEHMKTLVKKPAKRKNYLFFNSTWDIWEAKKGVGPYKGFEFDYDEFKFVCLLGIAGNGLCTLDADIKSLKDMENKKVILDSGRGKGREMAYFGVMQAAGVNTTKMKFQFARGKAAADTLRDGLVDVIYTGHVLKKLPDIFANSPYQAELVATKDVYFLSFNPAQVESFKSQTGHPMDLATVPAQMLGPMQTEPLTILTKPLGFAAHVSMPDHVVTEILRVVYENAHKFKEYTAMGEVLTKTSLASLSIPAEGYHPAAVNFFNEKGIKIGGLE